MFFAHTQGPWKVPRLPVHSTNPYPGHFSYERPGYTAQDMIELGNWKMGTSFRSHQVIMLCSLPFLTLSVVHLLSSLGRTSPKLPACGSHVTVPYKVIVMKHEFPSPSSGNSWVTFRPRSLPTGENVYFSSSSVFHPIPALHPPSLHHLPPSLLTSPLPSSPPPFPPSPSPSLLSAPCPPFPSFPPSLPSLTSASYSHGKFTPQESSTNNEDRTHSTDQLI